MGSPQICPKRGWRLDGVGTFGFVACVQEVAATPGELLADADLIDYTMGASEKAEEEAIGKAVDFSTTARRQTVDWSRRTRQAEAEADGGMRFGA